MMRQIRNQATQLGARGDTVVEVLMSIAVISLVLSGAYVTANRSLQGARLAEERNNALKMAEAQVEQIKYMASLYPDRLFGAGAPASYCLVNSATVASTQATPDPKCKVDSSGTPTTAEPAYTLTITRNVNTFVVTSTWTKFGSNTLNSAELKYRAYQ